MRHRKSLVLCLLLSFFLHILFIFSVTFKIKVKEAPLIYGWFNILDKEDLSFKKKDVFFPETVDFSLDSLRRDYFSSPVILNNDLLQDKNNQAEFSFIPELKKEEAAVGMIEQDNNYFYLWEKASLFRTWEENAVSYKVFVSSHGKVFFIYPEKLLADSSRHLYMQDYIKGAAFFLTDRLFWTKLEKIVK